ncbi:hypothetical protein NA57DRAFT_18701, partial [Rhizodiscina lignyota]
IYTDPPSNESNDAWAAMMPTGRGFIMFERSEFDPAKNESHIQRAGLAVFHQIHCLDIIRVGYYNALNNITNDPNGHVNDFHLRHCFDYLRQTLMCCGDTSLEWVANGHHGVDGWGVTHECRDYKAIFDWAEEKR